MLNFGSSSLIKFVFIGVGYLGTAPISGLGGVGMGALASEGEEVPMVNPVFGVGDEDVA